MSGAKATLLTRSRSSKKIRITRQQGLDHGEQEEVRPDEIRRVKLVGDGLDAAVATIGQKYGHFHGILDPVFSIPLLEPLLLRHGWPLAPENLQELVGNSDGVDCIDSSIFGDIVAVQLEKILKKYPKMVQTIKKI